MNAAHNANVQPQASTFQPASAPIAPKPWQSEPATCPWPVLRFDDPKEAFQAKSTRQLLQSLAVFQTCACRPFVDNAGWLLPACRRTARPVVDWAVRHTFFKHFCAGECVDSIRPTVAYLAANGIRPILQYAAEDNVRDDAADSTDMAAVAEAAERACDCNLAIFMRSVRDSDNVASTAIVAIKVTALAPPALLERASAALAGMQAPEDRGALSARLQEALAPHLTPAEQASLDKCVRRLDALATAVQAKGNARMMVDAEHSHFQPAIDALALRLQRRHNRAAPVIFNTYQCYLKDTAARLDADIARAAREGWKFGAKAVRGAYLVFERAHAAALGADSPVQDTLEATHANYDRCVERVLRVVADGGGELMVASHNQASVAAAAAAMQRLGLHPATSGVYFGQLLGMADHLSFTLGRSGFRAHKILPYGPVPETLQYLLRRAQENSDFAGGCAKEVRMIRAELGRRWRERWGVARVWPGDAAGGDCQAPAPTLSASQS
ncbi:hypothetical protein WJX81_000815 [Elliptochloris bilobata]|uniref:Proline dehydrogenase n=1 Tax=Elliptochloris bilobata TaxID=381761 RepID=A0AAW1RKG4_9CHLO